FPSGGVCRSVRLSVPGGRSGFPSARCRVCEADVLVVARVGSGREAVVVVVAAGRRPAHEVSPGLQIPRGVVGHRLRLAAGEDALRLTAYLVVLELRDVVLRVGLTRPVTE